MAVSTFTSIEASSTQASPLQAEETLAMSPTEDLHYQLPAQVFLFYQGSTSRGDSSNISEENLFYQLPAQVGSLAPILGEAQLANIVEIQWLLLLSTTLQNRLRAQRVLTSTSTFYKASRPLYSGLFFDFCRGDSGNVSIGLHRGVSTATEVSRLRPLL